MGAASDPLEYADLVCELDADPFARETASDLENLMQDVLHVLIEDAGSNLDDPDRGIGIDALLSGSDVQLTFAAAQIDAQITKDSRIDSSSTTLSQPDGGFVLNGEKFPAGSFLIEVMIGVNGAFLPLSFGFSQAGGLRAP